jgi:hypothetical protein
MSQPSNTIPCWGAQKLDSVFSAIQKEFRRIQKNSEEFRRIQKNSEDFRKNSQYLDVFRQNLDRI